MANKKAIEFPLVFNKKYLAEKVFGRSFEWVRKHVLTNEELEHAGIQLERFKKYKDFPPDIGNKIKNIVLKKIN